MADHLGTLVLQRTTAQATRFTGMGHVINHLALEGGIGGDNPINAITHQRSGHLIYFFKA